MIVRVEEQREIHVFFIDYADSSAMMVQTEHLKSYGASKGNIEKKFKAKGTDKKCDHCSVDGHTRIHVLICMAF